MRVFSTLSRSSDETEAEESERYWATWQRRSFYGLGALSFIGLIGIAVAAPSGVAAGLGTIMGGFGMLLITAYLVTGVTRRIRSQLQQRGYGRHFSDRYWATLSYLSVILAPIATLARNATAATSAESTSLIVMYPAVFIALFLFSIPFYELLTAARFGYRRIQSGRATS